MQLLIYVHYLLIAVNAHIRGLRKKCVRRQVLKVGIAALLIVDPAAEFIDLLYL